MTYGQLLMATALGWIFFGDKPDALAMLGAAIIIGAGLYLWSTGRMKVPPKTDL
jgi:drug/metabolite transporter (DMT)-like permease